MNESLEVARAEARLTLVFEAQGTRTTLRRALAEPPLQVSRVRYDDPVEAGRARVTVLHQAGVIQGDRYALDIRAEAGSRATLTTAAATQVYRAPERGAEQTMQIEVGDHASFSYLPEPVILCAGADFQQTTSVRLAPTGQMVLLEVLVPGRLQRGEVWQFRRFRSRMTVMETDGRLLVAERADIQPEREPWVSTGVGEAPVVGTAYLLGDEYAALLPRLRRVTQDAWLGVDLLPNQAGVMVRMLGRSGSAVRETLVNIIRGIA